MGSNSALVPKQFQALFCLVNLSRVDIFPQNNLDEIEAEIFGESGPKVI